VIEQVEAEGKEREVGQRVEGLTKEVAMTLALTERTSVIRTVGPGVGVVVVHIKREDQDEEAQPDGDQSEAEGMNDEHGVCGERGEDRE
jgi:hypothetical protein